MTYFAKARTWIVMTLSAVLMTFQVQAQIMEPVKWEYSVRNDEGNKAEVVFTAKIDPGWHLYSQHVPEGGPIPTSFSLQKSKAYTASGPIKEGKPKEEFDPNFDMVLKWFSKKADFVQPITIHSEKDFTLTGELEFMVCNDEMCLPPEIVEYSIPIKGAKQPENNTIEKRADEDVSSIHNPVKWRFEVRNLNDGQADLTMIAKIEAGWHLYSQNIENDGPIPTAFEFVQSEKYRREGEVKEGPSKEEYDPNFMMTLRWFADSAIFTQRIKVLDAKGFKVKGELVYMVCNDKMCLPPEYVDFEFDIPKIDESSVGKVTADGTSDDGNKKETLWVIFAAGFAGGLLALLMPCIFPMIPLTVSFFTKQSRTKAEGINKAIIYGLSIIVIYVALGMFVTIAFGSNALNALSTNPWLNLAFFALFLIFAISFFGAFEITLPSSWVNKADAASNRGGLIGIFFMAFTLSLVSFSCTGPIIGTLLVSAAQEGERLGPAIGMLGFSVALALPFALFAAFPGWLNTMPKSGGWLNTVKVTLGFLELALALKFLSTADMVVQAGLLERELFMSIWVGITLATAFYLFGFFRMPHDSPIEKIGVSRMLFGLFFMVFGLYLLPGIWGAPVKIISGFPPPEFYAEAPGGFGGGHADNSKPLEHSEIVRGNHCPPGVDCFNDFETGLEFAKRVNKPILIDFTGWGCVNCRRMEANVWTDPRVMDRLQNKVVLISLYVDERTKLPEEEQRLSEVTGKKIKTIGNKWSEFQMINFKANAQPFYVILGHDDLTPLIEPSAYDLDIMKYINWLDNGIKAFENP